MMPATRNPITKTQDLAALVPFSGTGLLNRGSETRTSLRAGIDAKQQYRFLVPSIRLKADLVTIYDSLKSRFSLFKVQGVRTLF